MCTLSWVFNESGYSLFFNRDEQRSRPAAIAPNVFSDGVRAIYPVDPQGKGTWIGCNEYGLSFSLLNFYQGRTPKGALISRGQIITRLLEAVSTEAAQVILAQFDFSRYAPFSLFVFSLDKSCPLVSFVWNGKALAQTSVTSPFISSAVDFERVNDSRKTLYHSMLSDTSLNNDMLFSFHQSHVPAKSKMSVCMHREDAKTVSLSHIEVGSAKATFAYCATSPCSLSDYASLANTGVLNLMLKRT